MSKRFSFPVFYLLSVFCLIGLMATAPLSDCWKLSVGTNCVDDRAGSDSEDLDVELDPIVLDVFHCCFDLLSQPGKATGWLSNGSVSAFSVETNANGQRGPPSYSSFG
jgi:hypothetical protein